MNKTFEEDYIPDNMLGERASHYNKAKLWDTLEIPYKLADNLKKKQLNFFYQI